MIVEVMGWTLVFFLWTAACLFYIFAGMAVLVVLQTVEADELNPFLVLIWPVVVCFYAIKGLFGLIRRDKNANLIDDEEE